MIKQKRPPKTPKEKLFVKEYAKTLNATEAASRVYDVKTRESARSIGSENLLKLDVSSQLDGVGLTDEYLYQGLLEGTQAQKTVSAQILVKADGGIVKKEDEGIIEYPDHPTRHKYYVTALELKGKLKREGLIDNTIQNTVITVIAYGNSDPLSVRSSKVESAGIGGVTGPTQISGPELAPQGTENNTGDQPAH